MVDVMSPFFISGSDNPNIVFTSDLLRDGNYTDWADEISNALFAKNKFGFVDGSIPIPEEGSPELLLWKRYNAMVRGWLHSSMDKEIRNSVKHAKTAREVWEDLQERFGSESAPELKHILSLTRQEKMSVSAYYTKLKGLWDEIQAISPLPKCKCGGCTCDINKQLIAMKEKERLYEFLMGLDESFGTVRTQILSTKPMVSLGASFHLVSEDERQKQIYATGKTSVEAAAFQTQAARLNDKNWGAPKENRREPKKCTHCGKLYHSVEECYEIVGYPKQGEKGGRNGGKKEDSRYKLRGANKSAHMAAGSSPLPGIATEQYSKLVEYFSKSGDTSQVAREENPTSVNMAGNINNLNSWIIDPGATEHITCDSMLLENETSCGTEIPVKIPNGETVPVKSIGNANLPNGLKLNQVLNIPDFKCNLLSVSKLTRNLNCALTFFPDFCVMQDLPLRNLIGIGRHCDGLYLLEPTIKKGTALSWHKRLGHASSLKIQQLDGSFGSFGKNNEHCDSCLRAKLTRLPFPISSIQTASCFELIHCDIWGGYRTPSLSGAHYFLTIVDDFSRGMWVFLMKHKSDVSHFLISFCNMVHKQFGKCVKRIRSDNGVEFQSKSMIDYYGDNGIILETSCTDTPQQNGIVERKHRHILEITRALRFEAELPIEFWGECVLTATYIINRLPSKVLKHKTPYEILFGKAPSSYIWLFGLCQR